MSIRTPPETDDRHEHRTHRLHRARRDASANRQRHAEFFERDGSLAGPGYSAEEAAGLPEQYHLPGVIVKPDRPPRATSRR